MPRVRLTILLLALGLLAAACSDDSRDAGSTLVETPTTGVAAVESTTIPPPPEIDRLVVVDGEGRVVAMDRDGENAVVLSEAEDVPFQPVWSPDSSKVAYSDRRGTASLVVVDADGSNLQRAAAPTAPFYFLWSPSGDRIASLRNGPTGIVFDITTVGAELVLEERDTGQPYYYDWSPEGDRLVAHVGMDRLDVLDPVGNDKPLSDRPGAFRAPDWTTGDVIAPLVVPNGQELVRIAEDGEPEVLAEMTGAAVFGVSPDGSQLAVQSLATGDNSVSASFSQATLAANRLYVIDLESGGATQLTDTPALAFFWSPDGTRLLLLGAGESRGEAVWSVWDGEEMIPGPMFRPGQGWITEFLPFFDQYALGVSLWAPDSTAYAFPGTIDGQSGIWVTRADGEATTRVASGTWVAWSPD